MIKSKLGALFLLALSLSAAVHKDWRILITNSGTNTVSLEEMQMYDPSGTLLTTGGTPTASSTFSGFPASNAFDGSYSTFWDSSGTPSITAPEWLWYSMAGAVDVATVRITCREGSTSQAPVAFTVQYSDDSGVTWTGATGNLTPTWANSGPTYVTWSFAVDPPLGGFYVDWRAYVVTTQSGTAPSSAAFELRDVSGGSNLASSTPQFALVSDYFSPDTGVLAFDGNPATFWAGANAPPGNWIGQPFNQPRKFIQFTWTARNDSFFAQAPSQFIMQGSNDASTWTNVYTCNMGVWTIGSTQTCGVSLDQRGNIAYNQIRASDREGAGAQVQMFGGGATFQGHATQYDNNGNVIDSGGFTMPRVATPPAHASFCVVGMASLDSSGNFYWCYAVNAWARIGPGGYSTSF